MNKLPNSSKRILNKVRERIGNAPDIINKKINFAGTKIDILFSETLVDKVIINEYILEYFEKINKNLKIKDVLSYLQENIPTHKTLRVDNYEKVIYYLLSGYTIIIIDEYAKVLAIETRALIYSPIQESMTETVIKGPKDAFTENYQANIGLIRRRMKDDKLWINELLVGGRSKTLLGILYIDDIVDKQLVQYITKKIKKINIDAIMDSNYIIDLISENKRNVLPNYISTERPDQVVQYLLKGRIAIVVENTPFVAIIPALFIEFFHTPEDLYGKTKNISLTRIIRVIAFIITIFTPAIYVALITYNHEAIPEPLLVSFSAQRDGVPFPTIVEAILMIVTFEILKESDTRIPNKIGSALTIVGTLVLGEAAVTAGIVSPIMVIVIAITAISGLIVYNFDMVNGIRWWRFAFLVLASLAGMFGVLVASLLFLVNLTSMKSFGIPYFAPFGPYYSKEHSDAVILSDELKYNQRNSLTASKNTTKSGGDN